MFSSCNDFLDTMPDSRTEVNNEKKITDILVSAYSQTYPIMFYELSSDNTMDSGAKYNPYWKSITQYYLWQDVSEVDDDDPNGIWQGCYSAISSANMALQAIEEMGDPVSLNPQKGEALLCRAYWHFVLANTFCMPYNAQTADTAGSIYFQNFSSCAFHAPETFHVGNHRAERLLPNLLVPS